MWDWTDVALLSNKYCHSAAFCLWICPLILSSKNDFTSTMLFADFPSGSVVKNPPSNQESHRSHRFNPWVRKIPWRRAWQPTALFLPGESHGQKTLVGYSLWGLKQSDTTEWLSMLFMKVVKKVNPKSSHCKENLMSLILYLYEMMDVH